jgi:hypothetical protein
MRRKYCMKPKNQNILLINPNILNKYSSKNTINFFRASKKPAKNSFYPLEKQQLVLPH